MLGMTDYLYSANEVAAVAGLFFFAGLGIGWFLRGL